MSIRKKALLVFLAFFLILLTIFFTCSTYYILGGFKQLERMAMATDLRRVESAVHARLQDMSRTVHDWSSWDETYDYVRGDNPEFLRVNLSPEVFTEQDMNIILILDLAGAIVWGMAHDLSNESMRELSSEEARVLAALPFQRFGDSQGQISGIVRLPASLLLVAARPIVMHSAESPAAGALLMGRYVDEDVISHVSSMTELNARIHPLGAEDPEAGVSRFVATERIMHFEEADEQTLVGYRLMHDLRGEPAAVIQVASPREVYQHGLATYRAHVLAFLGSFLILAGFGFLLLEKHVLSRLLSLVRQTSGIAAGGTPRSRVSLAGDDEISQLATGINSMLAQIEAGQNRLEQQVAERTVELSRAVARLESEVGERMKAQASLRERERHLHAVLHTVQAGILVVEESSGAVIHANTAALALLGRTREQVAGCDIAGILRPEDAEGPPTPPPSPGLDPVPMVLHGRELRPVLTTGARLTLDGRPSLLVSFLDRTELARALREQRDATRRAEAADKAKTQFLANMSHELRTPLNGIMGLLHLLKGTRLDPRQASYVDLCAEAAGHLAHVIDDILEYTRIESGSIELAARPFSFAETLDAVVNRLAPRNHKGLSVVTAVEPGLPRKVLGDEERVGLVLSHLLDNALKFSDSGPVRIEAWHIAGPPDGPGHILCCVRDNGVGMPEEMIEHFMRPFTQQDESNSRRHGGAGLGLSIACRLVPLMGGFLQFETAPAMGASACFTISAPRAEA